MYDVPVGSEARAASHSAIASRPVSGCRSATRYGRMACGSRFRADQHIIHCQYRYRQIPPFDLQLSPGGAESGLLQLRRRGSGGRIFPLRPLPPLTHTHLQHVQYLPPPLRRQPQKLPHDLLLRGWPSPTGGQPQLISGSLHALPPVRLHPPVLPHKPVLDPSLHPSRPLCTRIVPRPAAGNHGRNRELHPLFAKIHTQNCNRQEATPYAPDL